MKKETDNARAEAALGRLGARLGEESLTCLVVCGEREYRDTRRGIRPLLGLIAAGADVRGGMAADLIVGKAAALLYALMGVRGVYARVLSEGGLAVLRAHGIAAEYGERTQCIINRAGTGMCPMEETVLTIEDPAQAYAALAKRAEELSGSTHQGG